MTPPMMRGALTTLAATMLLSGASTVALGQAVTMPTLSVAGDAAGSLTVPTADQARRDIDLTPGGVEVVPDTVFRNTPAQTIKDIVGWVPGVYVQTRWGDDARISIRGSGLSRNYGNRGVQLYMDSIPINTADGYVDLFEIDPTAYRYAEVFKGANALRYGANSLGGAINLVTATGRDAAPFEARLDAGSFGFLRGQASTGGSQGPVDWFVTGSAWRADGFRDHSNGHGERASGNVGYQFSPDAETRFYLNANSVRQRMPGEVTKASALNTPRRAAAFETLFDNQRNIDTGRLANKTTLRFGPTTVDFGVFGLNRHVMHPIYQWLDYRYHEYGGFARATDDRLIGGFRNRLVAGVNLQNGKIDARQYVNQPGAVKGALTFSAVDRSENVSAYAENSFYVLPQVALVAGTQFLHATRKRTDRFLSNGNQSGSASFDLWSPKFGLLWDVDPAWQVFGNISRSAEVPSFAENTFTTVALSNIKAQTAVTYEIGTRGTRPDLAWDVSLYRSNLKNELQCLTAPAIVGACNVRNAGPTVHQGLELGFGAAFLKQTFIPGDSIWFNLAYTYSDFYFDGDPTYGDNRLPGVPPHYVRAEVLYKQAGGFYAGPNVEWVPKAYYADNANQVTVDPYALLNFKIGFDAGQGWSGYLEGRNLLDKHYIASAAITETANAASALFNPGTGRAVYGGVRYTW